VGLIVFVLQLAFYAIIIWIILSYVINFGRLPWGHPVRRVYDAIDRVLQPILSPLRRVLPPLRIGTVALDLSPLVLIIGIQILISILR
jgi:YggT family protein